MKQRASRLLPLLLALCLALSLLPGTALAENEISVDGTNLTLEDAIGRVTESSDPIDEAAPTTIQLTADITDCSVTIPANKSIKLDLNGRTITAESGEAAITVAPGAKLILTGEGGTIQGADGDTAAECVVLNHGLMDFSGGTIVSTAENAALINSSIPENATSEFTPKLTINGGSVDAEYIAVKNYSESVEDNKYYPAELYVESGSVRGGNQAVQNLCNAWITGGDFDGCFAAWADAQGGHTTISGGTFCLSRSGVVPASVLGVFLTDTALDESIKMSSDLNISGGVKVTGNDLPGSVLNGASAPPVVGIWRLASGSEELTAAAEKNVSHEMDYKNSVLGVSGGAYSGEVEIDYFIRNASVQPFRVVETDENGALYYNYYTVGSEGTEDDMRPLELKVAQIAAAQSHGTYYYWFWGDDTVAGWRPRYMITLDGGSDGVANVDINWYLQVGSESEKGFASSGDRITVSPRDGYTFDTYQVTAADGSGNVTVDNGTRGFSFDMPAYPVTISFTLEEAEEDPDSPGGGDEGEAYTISGKVYDDDNDFAPLAGVTVRAQRPSGYTEPEGGTPPDPVSTTTAADGTFTLNLPKDGKYMLYVVGSTAGTTYEIVRYWNDDEVDIPTNTPNVTGVELHAFQQYNVTGTFRVEDDATLVANDNGYLYTIAVFNAKDHNTSSSRSYNGPEQAFNLWIPDGFNYITITGQLEDGTTVTASKLVSGLDALEDRSLGTLTLKPAAEGSVTAPGSTTGGTAELCNIGRLNSPGETTDTYYEGSTVFVAVDPASGYELSELTYTANGTTASFKDNKLSAAAAATHPHAIIYSKDLYYFTMPASDVTVNAAFAGAGGNSGGNTSGGNTSGGNTSGGGSSAGGTSPAVSAPATSGTTTTTTTTAGSTTSGTTASATVSSTNMDNAVNSAVTEAAKQGTAPVVEVRVNTSAQADSLNVSLPAASLEKLAEAGNSSLVITSGIAEVTLDHTALSALVDQATGSTIILEVSPVAESALNEAQQVAVGAAEVTVLDLSLVSNGVVIQDFNEGKITVTLPYALPAGQSADDVVVYYLDDDGSITPCDTSYSDDKVTFTTI